MKRNILTFLVSFFTASAYADYYTYIENPEPELYELVQYKGPSANKVITDENGNFARACWISHNSTPEISIALRLKSTNININICSVNTYKSRHGLHWFMSDNCIFSKGEAGNTIWINAKKMNGEDGEVYRTWDCG